MLKIKISNNKKDHDSTVSNGYIMRYFIQSMYSMKLGKQK